MGISKSIDSLIDAMAGSDVSTEGSVSKRIDAMTAAVNDGTIEMPDDITVPTKTSDLENDSGFITSSDIPAIPTKTSDLTNDSNFTTINAVSQNVFSGIILASTTEGSSKTFTVTVNDSGELTATENHPE